MSHYRHIAGEKEHCVSHDRRFNPPPTVRMYYSEDSFSDVEEPPKRTNDNVSPSSGAAPSIRFRPMSGFTSTPPIAGAQPCTIPGCQCEKRPKTGCNCAERAAMFDRFVADIHDLLCLCAPDRSTAVKWHSERAIEPNQELDRLKFVMEEHNRRRTEENDKCNKNKSPHK